MPKHRSLARALSALMLCVKATALSLSVP